MTRHTPRASLFVTACLLGGVALTLALGPVDPPLGPVAPTAKPLVELEPRIAVNDVNTPGDAGNVYRISQPGSYYLTGNLTGQANKNLILIDASHVTLDLMGFTLQGVAGSFSGVKNNSSATNNIVVRNGSVTGFAVHGVHLNGAGTSGSGDIVESVRAVGNTFDGITAPENSVVRSCTVTGNGRYGIFVFGNSIVESCNARSNGSDGIYFGGGGGVLRDSTARQNGGVGMYAGASCTVTGCAAVSNAAGGISAASLCTITDCSSTSNTGDGILATFSSSVVNCTSGANTGCGIHIIAPEACTVRACTANKNTLDGILAERACLIVGNTCSFNGNNGDGAGIHIIGFANRLEDNNCTFNDRGIDVDQPNNIINRNTCSRNTNNWDIVANNVYGPIVDRTVPASAAATGNAAPSTLVSTEPNANFSF